MHWIESIRMKIYTNLNFISYEEMKITIHYVKITYNVIIMYYIKNTILVLMIMEILTWIHKWWNDILENNVIMLLISHLPFKWKYQENYIIIVKWMWKVWLNRNVWYGIPQLVKFVYSFLLPSPVPVVYVSVFVFYVHSDCVEHTYRFCFWC